MRVTALFTLRSRAYAPPLRRPSVRSEAHNARRSPRAFGRPTQGPASQRPNLLEGTANWVIECFMKCPFRGSQPGMQSRARRMLWPAGEESPPVSGAPVCRADSDQVVGRLFLGSRVPAGAGQRGVGRWPSRQQFAAQPDIVLSAAVRGESQVADLYKPAGQDTELFCCLSAARPQRARTRVPGKVENHRQDADGDRSDPH